MKLTKKEILELWKVFKEASKLQGKKFAYAILINEKKIKDEVETIQTIAKPSEEYMKYIKEQMQIVNEFTVKDEHGNPIGDNGIYQLQPKRKDIAQFKLEQLSQKYKTDIEKQNKVNEEINTILSEEIDIDFYKISFDDIPEEVNKEQLEKLMLIVKE